ncbi:hypothetical protein APUTEX25_005050, partial [Auxenochlorella protothecoides]
SGSQTAGASTPAFGVAASGFGGFGTPSATPASSAAAAAPTGASTPSFGATPAPSAGAGASKPAFSFGGAAASAAGAAPSAAAASSAASTPAFSFGGSAPATPGSQSGATPPAGAPAISFGATPGAPAQGTAAASTPALSFGAAPAAASTPAAGTGPAAGATIAAASGAGFSFGATPAAGVAPIATGTAPASSTAPSSAATAGAVAATGAAAADTGAAAVSSLAAPSEIRGKMVDDIIAGWASELEARSASFTKHAAALAEWDAVILSNRRSLLALEQEVRKVLHAQEALERKLAMLDTHQRGIHETLTGMEHEAARLAQEEAGLQDEGTRDRDVLYARAERVGAQLADLGALLHRTVADINANTAASLGDTDSPLGKVVRILNNNLQALALIDARTEEARVRLNSLRASR